MVFTPLKAQDKIYKKNKVVEERTNPQEVIRPNLQYIIKCVWVIVGDFRKSRSALRTIQNFKLIVGSIRTLFQCWLCQIEIKVIERKEMSQIELRKKMNN